MLARGNIQAVATALGMVADLDEKHENRDFPLWNVLLTEPSAEEKSKDWLKRCSIFTYLPTFKKWHCRRAGRRYVRACAVIPGLLFMPQVMTWIDGFERKLEWSRVRGFMKGAGGQRVILELEHVEAIMRIEAKLNKPDCPVDAHGTEIKAGDRVRFIDPANERLFGEGIVFEVASFNRIGVEASGLFAGRVKIYVPADEIAVM